jgi:hypothetical protein
VTRPQELTLKHYIAWSKSKGTVKAYNMHATVLENASGTKILSLYLAKKLATHLTELTPTKVDMCPSSCIPYTGKYETYESCPYPLGGNKICGKPQYKPKAISSKKNKSYA